MRVLPRVAHRAKQLEPLLNGRLVLAAVLGERNAFDILHNKPRRPVRQRVRVIEPRDGRMIQPREHPLLAEETLASARGYPGIAENLDRDQVAEILPFGEIYLPHAAFAQFSHDLVRAKLVRPNRWGTGLLQQVIRDVSNIAFE